MFSHSAKIERCCEAFTRLPRVYDLTLCGINDFFFEMGFPPTEAGHSLGEAEIAPAAQLVCHDADVRAMLAFPQKVQETWKFWNF